MSILMAGNTSIPAAVTLLVSVNPAQASGIISGGGTAFTNYVTASCSNGIGPYTSAWTYVSGDVFTVSDPGLATTRFSAALGFNESKGGRYLVTMTDVVGNTGTRLVDVTAIDISFEGGIPL